MGLVQVILSNTNILALGLGIGILIALIIYFYNIIFKKDQAKASETLKDVAIVVFYLIMLFALDILYNQFLASWLGLSSVPPGTNLRLAEAVIYKDIDKFRETLLYVYLADFILNLFGSFHVHIHNALNPEVSLLTGSSILKGIANATATLLSGKAALDPYKSETDMNIFAVFLSPMQMLYTASYGMFLVLVYKYVKLTIITYLPLIMSIFVPIGLLLIFLPITRKVGLTILGLAITLYYLFPVFIIYSDTVLRNMPDFDYRYISSYISPTIVEFLDRSPTPQTPGQQIGYKYAFIEREKMINNQYVKQGNIDQQSPSDNNSIAKVDKETIGTIYLYSFVDSQSICENNDKEICREYETINIGNFRSENSLAPVASLGGNILKFATLARASAAVKEVVEASNVIALTNPVLVILRNIANIAINIAISTLYLTQVMPIPGVSQLLYGALNIPFIPFLIFKTILEVLIIVYKNILYGSITILLDIFLLITGYRAIASVIGAEQRILGLEKVL